MGGIITSSLLSSTSNIEELHDLYGDDYLIDIILSKFPVKTLQEALCDISTAKKGTTNGSGVCSKKGPQVVFLTGRLQPCPTLTSDIEHDLISPVFNRNCVYHESNIFIPEVISRKIHTIACSPHHHSRKWSSPDSPFVTVENDISTHTLDTQHSPSVKASNHMDDFDWRLRGNYQRERAYCLTDPTLPEVTIEIRGHRRVKLTSHEMKCAPLIPLPSPAGPLLKSLNFKRNSISTTSTTSLASFPSSDSTDSNHFSLHSLVSNSLRNSFSSSIHTNKRMVENKKVDCLPELEERHLDFMQSQCIPRFVAKTNHVLLSEQVLEINQEVCILGILRCEMDEEMSQKEKYVLDPVHVQAISMDEMKSQHWSKQDIEVWKLLLQFKSMVIISDQVVHHK